MPLFFRQADALSDALKNALRAAETLVAKLPDPIERAKLNATVAQLRQQSGDTDGAKVARERAVVIAAKVSEEKWPLSERLELANSLALAGDRAGADAILEGFKKQSRKEEILELGNLANIARVLHEIGDDKAARTLTREILTQAETPGPQQDATRYQLGVYDMALFGDPDGAEALLPKVKYPDERWATLREIARLRGKTDKAKGIAAMQRSLAIWQASKFKQPSHVPGLVNVMGQLGQSVEAKTLTDGLPKMFPAKADRDKVRQAQAQSYALLKLPQQALAALDAITDKSAKSSTCFDVADFILNNDDLITFVQVRKRVLALIPTSNPERAGMALFLEAIGASSLCRTGKKAEAAVLVNRATSELGKLKPDVAAGLIIAVCSAVVTSLMSLKK